MALYTIVFGVALSATLILTPLFKEIAKKFGAIDEPDARKVHKEPIPRLGGGAVVVGFILAVAAFFALGQKEIVDGSLTLGLLVGGGLIVAIGILDDLKGLPATWKFGGQILAATIAYSFGAQMTFLSNPFTGKILLLGLFAFPLTIFWVVGLTNAVNLLDGLDGLASGVAAIAGGTLFMVALHLGQTEAAVFSIALCGSALGFLRYNFFPASIFLGDTGSLFLGYMLATISVIGVLKSTLLLALVVPLLILGIPIFDTATSILRRVKNRQPIFKPDRRHLHHRLLENGYNQQQVVLLIYFATFFLSLIALGITLTS